MFTVPNRCKCQNGSHGPSRLCKAGNSGNEPAELDPAPLSENGFGHCDDTHPFIYELPQDYLGEGLHSTWQDLEYRRPESSICSFAIRGNLESCESKQGRSKEDRAVEMTTCTIYGKVAPIKIESSHQNHFRASISPITSNESRGLSPQVETYRTCLHPYQSAPGVYADLEAAKSDDTLLRTQFMQYSNFANLPGMDGGGSQEPFAIEKSEPWSTFPISLQPDPYDDEATYSDTPKKSRGAFQQAVMSASCLAVGVGAALDAGSYPWAWSDWNCNEAQSTFSTEQSQPWNETAICHGHTMISSVMFTIATTGLYHLHRDCQHQDHLLFSGITVGIATGLLAGQDLYDAVLELMPWTILLSLLLNMVIKIVLSMKRGSKPDLGKAISESSCRKSEQA